MLHYQFMQIIVFEYMACTAIVSQNHVILKAVDKCLCLLLTACTSH